MDRSANEEKKNWKRTIKIIKWERQSLGWGETNVLISFIKLWRKYNLAQPNMVPVFPV
jgi:hypothetical protein